MNRNSRLNLQRFAEGSMVSREDAGALIPEQISREIIQSAVQGGRADAGEQLTRPEGLFDVIVCAEIERRDLVALVRARGDHDDRHTRPGPHLLEYLHAVHVGKTEVKDDQVGTMRRDHRQRLLRAARHERVEAVGGQNGGHEILDVLLVLDDQYLIPDLHPLFPP